MQNDTTSVILAIAMGSIVFLAYMIFDSSMRKKKASQTLADRIAAEGGTVYEEDSPAPKDGDPLFQMDAKKSPMAQMLEGFLLIVGVNMERENKRLIPRFAHAGKPSVNAPIYYMFFQRIVSIPCVLIGISTMLSFAEGLARLQNIAFGVGIIALGVFGPYLYLQNMIQHREKILLRSFPDALDLLLVCVESGLALDAALGRVCKELGRAHPEITAELNRTRLELALLNDRSRALMNLGERTNLIPFRSLVAALIQTEKFGTSLTDTLRVLSEDYRITRLMIAENKAARLPAMMTIPLILFLLPSLLLIIMGPSIVRVIQSGVMG